MAKRNKIYFFTPTETKDRFVAGDEPTEATFKDFADSIPMKDEADSVATTSQQGLVVLATQSEIDNENGEGVTTSNQLPQTSVFNWSSSVLPVQLAVEKIKNGVKNVFRVSLTQTFIQFLEKATIPYLLGSTGQVLTKTGSETFEWQDVPTGFVPSGNSNQVVRGDGSYEDKYINVGLNGGTTGQILTKVSDNSGNYTWQTIDTSIAGGTTGQVLAKNSNTDGDYSWTNANSYTFSTVGSGQSIIDPSTTSNDIKYKGIRKGLSSTFPYAVITNGNDIEINIDKVNPNDGLTLDTGQVTWGAMGTPSTNDFYGWIQHMVDTINSKT